MVNEHWVYCIVLAWMNWSSKVLASRASGRHLDTQNLKNCLSEHPKDFYEEFQISYASVAIEWLKLVYPSSSPVEVADHWFLSVSSSRTERGNFKAH